MEDETLELSELLDRANSLRETIPDLADTDPFTDRTVYYYAQQRLLPRASRRRGPGTTYPADFVDRLLFIRRLQKERSLTLANIRDVMESVSPGTIHDVAHGLERLEIRFEEGERPEDREEHSEVVRLEYNDRSGPADSPVSRRRMSLPTNLVSESVSRDFLAPRLSRKARHDSRSHLAAERRIPVGDDGELILFRRLTPLQEKRVEQVVGLLRSILEEDD